MADNVTFYLKYRPQSLEQLIGQGAVKKTLLSSFQNNKLSHAYLFVGQGYRQNINSQDFGKDGEL